MVDLIGEDIFSAVTLTLARIKHDSENLDIPHSVKASTMREIRSPPSSDALFKALSTANKTIVMDGRQLNKMLKSDIQHVHYEDYGHRAMLNDNSSSIVRDIELYDIIAIAYARCEYENSITGAKKVNTGSPAAFIDMFLTMFGIPDSYFNNLDRQVCLDQITSSSNLVVITT